jgi:hypothetical protein
MRAFASQRPIVVLASLGLAVQVIGHAAESFPSAYDYDGVSLLPVCHKDELQPSEPSARYSPWTSDPYCIQPKGHKEYCVFSDALFGSGQGISVIAQKESGMKLAANELQRPGISPDDVTPEEKYEILERPGRGYGLFVKRDKVVEAGEIILVDAPLLLVADEVWESFPLEERLELEWMAVMQLPKRSRQRLLSLASSMEKGTDKVDNVVATNSFRQAHGEKTYLSVLAGISVSTSH